MKGSRWQSSDYPYSVIVHKLVFVAAERFIRWPACKQIFKVFPADLVAVLSWDTHHWVLSPRSLTTSSRYNCNIRHHANISHVNILFRPIFLLLLSFRIESDKYVCIYWYQRTKLHIAVCTGTIDFTSFIFS